MPQTLSASNMVTPGSLSPPTTEPTDGEQAGQPLLDGAPSSASLETLIQHLVPTADYYPEKAYIFTFLLSSRLFIEPRELLARVCHLCIEQQQLDQPVLDKARVRKFGPKLLQLLAEWTETFPRDFQEESTIGHLKDVVGRIAPCDEVGSRAGVASPWALPVPGLRLSRARTPGPSSPHPAHHGPSKSSPFLAHQGIRKGKFISILECHCGQHCRSIAWKRKHGRGPMLVVLEHGKLVVGDMLQSGSGHGRRAACETRENYQDRLDNRKPNAHSRHNSGSEGGTAWGHFTQQASDSELSRAVRAAELRAAEETAVGSFWLLCCGFRHQSDRERWQLPLSPARSHVVTMFHTSSRQLEQHWRGTEEAILHDHGSGDSREAFPASGHPVLGRGPRGVSWPAQPLWGSQCSWTPPVSQLCPFMNTGQPAVGCVEPVVQGEEPCFSDKTSNLEAYVKWFNRLCYLVATEICMPAKKKQRAQVIEFFIDVARECFNIGNFNSLMAIISGMNMSPVSRLKKTWAKVKTAKFFILEHQMDPTGNFCNYRTALRGAAHRSLTAHSSQEKIVIPFFSLLIKDIYFLNEGCANRLPNGHVNFEKFLELAKQVGEFITWKQVECPFEQDPSITHYLSTAPIFSEDGLYLASYESESPENQTEKERWKSLRSSILGKT
ncbi:PREDICTED: ras-GEF domain-containing family member 1C [Colobus angolensis palliatus]|uniref:ras-GEF domain-containing family member 1C n=1 Tax=Colobus angolensis palliatus TaxID=336983 RepID=UPI0005F564DA|nr:PREDICTED: ras-GEF domain-containing family member 1C [Colobus angolensis palliatus]